MALLKGKIALVTGAGTGIGRESAILLAREGAIVVLTGRRAGPLDEVARLIVEHGGQAVSRTLDIADRSAIVVTVAAIEALVNRRIPDAAALRWTV